MGVTFDGVNDFISITGTTGFANFATSVWVKFDTVAYSQSVLTHSTGDPNVQFSHALYLDNGRISAYLFDGGLKTLTGPIASPGAWYHVVLTAASGSTMRLYVNGTLAASTSVGNIWTSGSSWHVGQRTNNSNWNYLDGSVDDVRIWSSALSATDISDLFAAGTAMCGTVKSPYLWWALDDGSGTVATDSTGYSRNGTLSNGAAWSSDGFVCCSSSDIASPTPTPTQTPTSTPTETPTATPTNAPTDTPTSYRLSPDGW
jgi:hypothetical protein